MGFVSTYLELVFRAITVRRGYNVNRIWVREKVETPSKTVR
jgi:hypothetical protein